MVAFTAGTEPATGSRHRRPTFFGPSRTSPGTPSRGAGVGRRIPGRRAVRDERLEKAVEAYNAQSVHTHHLRSPEHIGSFLRGLRLVEPGPVRFTDWRPDPDSAGIPHEQGHAVGAVGPKE
ncbi:SAM-dependent methyltransferase [Streptomyces viridosporus]|uniref:SAM-dependent methyltransferase n=1 Tax=Streptomyces viridosporus TaxID=67581 RepID=UPI00210016FE|nr:SAM-dependent methyltransferase [Streptomyces viridosporus]